MRHGMEGWVTRDYGREGKGLNWSKARLGEFTWWLLKYGGTITDCYAMNTKFPRCYVQFAIMLPEGKRDEFMRESGFALEDPPRMALS